MRTINVHNYQDHEPEALAACVEHAERFQDCDVEIFVQPRVPLDAEPYKNPGWLEYLIVYKFSVVSTFGVGGLTVGAIQRKPGMAFEFHS